MKRLLAWLLIPVFAVIAAFAIATRWPFAVNHPVQQQVLSDYFNQVSTLVLQSNSPAAKGVARSLTLTVLPQLNGDRRGLILKFLAESNLLNLTAGTPLENADFSEAKLDRASLANLQLTGVNLQAAQLIQADLQAANLQSALLQTAILREANLQGAKLTEANLMRSNLQAANLEGADLTGASLRGQICGEQISVWQF
ncbi:MAG: pentapeptide repeat-containing protein [Leptolyngbyaceae cyanobacterium SM1_3_5]|nr:pentapeptide repeat-containing protein [Leptolyngbyaceae cyanobacterium SM1_3_5]